MPVQVGGFQAVEEKLSSAGLDRTRAGFELAWEPAHLTHEVATLAAARALDTLPGSHAFRQAAARW